MKTSEQWDSVNYSEIKYQINNSSQLMNITWELMNPMPKEILHGAGKLGF